MRLCPGHLQSQHKHTHTYTTSTITPPHFLLFMAPGSASKTLQALSHLMRAEQSVVETLEEESSLPGTVGQGCPQEVAFELKE